MDDAKNIIRQLSTVLEEVVQRIDAEDAPRGPLVAFGCTGEWRVQHNGLGGTSLCVDYTINGQQESYRHQLPRDVTLGMDFVREAAEELKTSLATHLADTLLRGDGLNEAFKDAVASMKNYPSHIL